MYKKKKQFAKRVQIIAGIALSLIAILMFFLAPEMGAGITASMALVPIFGSFKDGTFKELSVEEIGELSKEDQTKYFSEHTKWQKEILMSDFEKKMDEKTKDFLKADEIATIKADFMKAIEGMDIKALSKYVDTIDKLTKDTSAALDLAKEVKEIAKDLGSQITANKANEIPDVRRKSSREDHIKGLITLGFSSVSFKEFESRGFKGSTNNMCISQNENKIILQDLTTKATVDTSSHTGDVMISEVSDIVRDDAPTRRSHVRDLINVSMTDQAQIVAGQVYDFTDALTLGAIMLSENGEAPESVFKSKENTWGRKRIANSMRISKDEFRINGLQWVIDKVMAKLPDATLFVEDTQLLFGDGAGVNVKGLANDAQAFNLAPNAYVATDFLNVASYNGGTQSLITFNILHNMKNGDNLTIANATEASYNATHKSVEVINTTQVIIDLAYVAETLGNVAAWTGGSTSPFYHTIDGAQEYDTLAVADAILEAGEYANTGYVVHPSQATQMGLLKATDENYLNIQKDANGKITGVNGKPVITTTAMPYGKWINGDFSRNGLELREFEPLNIQFAEDVETAKKNEIVIVIQEQIIFPIYNPYWFIFGKFSTAKTQLETP
jgi:HK97 family phage major capsid protein